MNYRFPQNNIFLNTTRQRIANNLNDIDEIVEVESMEMTLREQFMAQVDAKGNSHFAGMENIKVPESFRIIFHQHKYDAFDNLLLDIYTKLQDLGQWSESTVHYRYNTAEEVTIVGSQIVPHQTASFWNNHFTQIGRVEIPYEIKMETETIHAPPKVKRQTGFHMSYSQEKTVSLEPHHASVTSDVTTLMPTGVKNSTIAEPPSLPRKSGASGVSNFKRRLEEIKKERLVFKAEKLALDDEVIMLIKSVLKMKSNELHLS
jgi:hypothetical protein